MARETPSECLEIAGAALGGRIETQGETGNSPHIGAYSGNSDALTVVVAIGAVLGQICRRMKVKNVRLFSRAMCSWCMDAKEWLDRRGIAYTYVDVGSDAAAHAEMVTLSNQPRVPVIEVDGHVLADFGADELEAWWKKMEFEK